MKSPWQVFDLILIIQSELWLKREEIHGESKEKFGWDGNVT